MILQSGYDYNKLWKYIKHYKCVSFDIYDTLIKRDVYTSRQLFLLVEKKLFNNNNELSYNFVESRFIAEKKARESKRNSEITLCDIYDCFIFDDRKLTDKEKKILIDLEVEMEVQISQINYKMEKIIRMCKEQKQYVILISDMYLSEDILIKLLEKNNIKQGIDYDKLFVSSEYGKTKYSGELYDEVLKMIDFRKDEIVHIGDAWRSDYIMPRCKGIKAVHIPTDDGENVYDFCNSDKGCNKDTMQILNKFQKNRLMENEDLYFTFGYECLGVLLYEFSNWIYQSVQGEEICFLSREGQLLYKTYNIMYPEAKKRYLHVSRKSLIMTILWKCNDIRERVLQLTVPHVFDLNLVLELLGVGEYTDESYSFRKYFNIEDLLTDQFAMDLLLKYDNEIVSKSKEQYEYFMSYTSFAKQKKEIIIADIGWKGTMQKALSMLFEQEKYREFIGYYIGVSNKSHKKINLKGYLFNDSVETEIEVDENEVFSFGGLFETLFTADHGSVKGYLLKNNRVLPVFYKHEFEGKVEFDKLQKVQCGALAFVKDLKDSCITDILEINKTLAFSKLKQFGNYPRKKDINLFKEFYFFDVTATQMCGQGVFYQYLRDIKFLKEDFMNCGWKVGFIKRNCNILPAHLLYCLARGKKNG